MFEDVKTPNFYLGDVNAVTFAQLAHSNYRVVGRKADC